ncbi:hypothetical protein HZC27_01020 [Candidatus Roizmanbacteria bacterium]|nr:hypothetical protein [Candidatus Roizmanbacteria bacterium]
MGKTTGEIKGKESFGHVWSVAKKRANNLLVSTARTAASGLSGDPHEAHTDFFIRGLSVEHKGLITPWLDSIALFSRMRDTNLLKNKGYGEGATTILALANEYAKENNISIEEAQRIMAGAAIMMHDHENINSYSEALRGRSNGLLQTLKEGAQPILAHISDNMREGLLPAVDVALAGDILDKVVPPEAALMRSFSTQYSQNRPFHVSGHREEILNLIRNGTSTGQEIETPFDSDVYSILRQAYNQDTLLLQNPLFKNNEALRNLLVSNALSKIELFRHIGRAVMNGDYSIFEQFPDADADKLAINFTGKPRIKGEERQLDSADPKMYLFEEIEDFDAISDAIYQDIRAQNPIQLVAVGSELEFQGATSMFHETNDPERIVKQYHHGDEKGMLWGFIPISDPLYRAELVASEIAGLGVLGQALNAIPVIVKEEQSWRHDIGIEMNRLKPESLTGYPTPEQYRNIARRIIDYHFDSRLCPEVDLEDGETMTTFIRSLLLGGSIQGRDPIPGEVGILRERLKEDPAYLDSLSSSIASFLSKFEPTISRFGKNFHEPIMGHGDIKLDNLALVDGEPQMLDVAPWTDWRINSKRMDAAFLYADLLVHKRVDEAKAYWDEYNKAYQQKIGGSEYNTKATEQDLQVIDGISLVYRYMILYRLYKNKAMISKVPADVLQYVENTDEARRLLDEVMANLKEMTGAI